MSRQVWLIDAPPGLQSLEVRLGKQLAGLGLTLVASDNQESLLRASQPAEARASLPEAVVFGPDWPRPLAVARSVRAGDSSVQFVFLLRRDQEAEFRRQMSLAPMIGSQWSIARDESREMVEVIRKAAAATRQRRHLRTTLDRVNYALASSAPPDLAQMRKLAISERRLDHILRHAQDAIITMDERGVVQSWNEGAQRVFRLEENEALGRPIRELAGNEWRERMDGLVERVRAADQSILEDINCGSVGGAPLHVSLSLSAVTDVAGRRMAVCAIARDITGRKQLEDEQRELNEQLAAANDALAQSNMELQQFAYVASHDLQAPLRHISGFVQLLQNAYRGRLDEKADQWIDRTVEGAERMQALIRDQLAFSRIDSRSRPFQPFVLREAFDRAVAVLEPSIAETGAEVTCGELPVVDGDAAQITQLFQNLIGNAIKYHGDEPPRVRVTAEKSDHEWIVAVKDNGIGIDRKHHERIFEVFRRLHPPLRYPGTGIGLAICRRIVHRHGGRIWVESAAGAGSVFYCAFPESRSSPT